jgi:hypothetical protein
MAWVTISVVVGAATSVALLAGVAGLIYFLTRNTTNGSEINRD